ncbi:hypothetical protein M758_UG323000 [Ceratodon purpureus]|nr:hypothetical protein M758_UG323000 [Ceratodon purpureus]
MSPLFCDTRWCIPVGWPRWQTLKCNRGGGTLENIAAGSLWWFRVEQGLNGYGYIPGTKMGSNVCSKEEYIAFWGKKNYNNGGRFKLVLSPRTVRRIQSLYQRVFQKPVGSSDTLPYHFGLGLLAERNGFPVNWTGYARKVTHRGTGDRAHLGASVEHSGNLTKSGMPFEFVSLEDLRKRTPPQKWPRNEAANESDNEEGRKDDWDVNVQFPPTVLEDGKFVPAPNYVMPPAPMKRFVFVRGHVGRSTYGRTCISQCI